MVKFSRLKSKKKKKLGEAAVFQMLMVTETGQNTD
jgi:hypothetical protein